MFERARRFVSVVLGEGGAAAADPDDLFNVSTGYVTLGANGFDSVDRAGLCFTRVDTVDFDRVVDDIEDLLAVDAEGPEEVSEVTEDDYGYTWVLLEDPDFESLVTAVHMVADTLIEEGYERYLLCAVFAFERDAEVYLIYNFKRGRWYPFVPVAQGRRDEDVERELADLVDGVFAVETDEDRQYALWGIPF